MATYKAKSTVIALLTRGIYWGVLTPWHIEIDTIKKRVHIAKRNWYLVSVDEDTFLFNSVRHIKIDKSLFGADLHIRIYAGSTKVRGISKKSARIIRDMLLNGDNESNVPEIYVDTADDF